MRDDDARAAMGVSRGASSTISAAGGFADSIWGQRPMTNMKRMPEMIFEYVGVDIGISQKIVTVNGDIVIYKCHSMCSN